MSIILKGIDLPSCSNEDCIVVIRKDKAEVWQTGFKERTIEAIQIPKGHGRLIDGDKFKETIGDTNMDIYTDEVKEHIDDAPTILEAEE